MAANRERAELYTGYPCPELPDTTVCSRCSSRLGLSAPLVLSSFVIFTGTAGGHYRRTGAVNVNARFMVHSGG